MAEFIISKEEAEEYESYKDNIRNLLAVRQYLESRFKRKYCYASTMGQDWQMTVEDYKKGNSELTSLSKVIEGLGDKILVIQNEENTKEIKDSYTNSLLYYEKFDVAIATISKFTNTGVLNETYSFFSDEKKYLEFHEVAVERSKRLNEKEIIVFTDGPKGVMVNRQLVTHMIDKSQVVLEEKIKKDIYESIDQFFKENKEFYQKYNIPHKRGVLLYGEPGNGKTTLVKSLVGTIDAPIVYWQVNEYTTSDSVRAVFDSASEMNPVVLVIEDLDSLPRGTRSTFLNTLDGATTKEGIFLIGTTNYPEHIDKALINRVGRFDQVYEIKLPSEELRFDYLKIRGIGDFIHDEQIQHIAKETKDFSFVQLSEIFRRVAYAEFHGEEYNINDKIEELRINNERSKKNKWNTDKEVAMGFQR